MVTLKKYFYLSREKVDLMLLVINRRLKPFEKETLITRLIDKKTQ